MAKYVSCNPQKGISVLWDKSLLKIYLLPLGYQIEYQYKLWVKFIAWSKLKKFVDLLEYALRYSMWLFYNNSCETLEILKNHQAKDQLKL